MWTNQSPADVLRLSPYVKFIHVDRSGRKMPMPPDLNTRVRDTKTAKRSTAGDPSPSISMAKEYPGIDSSGELRTQKLKSHLVRTQSLNVLPLKPAVGQYIAMHSTLTARDFFLTYFYLLVHSPAFFPKPPLISFLCWLWLTPVPV